MTEAPVLLEGTDTLVLACGHRAEDTLLDTLRPDFDDLHGIGDCLSPRTAEEAILEGLKVGAAL